MNLLAKILLVLIYPLFVVVGLWRRMTGRDTLGLRHPPEGQSFWIVRDAESDVPSYFLETSVAEGKPAPYQGSDRRTDKGAASWMAMPLVWLARLFVPPRKARTGTAMSAADRNEKIPDEIYTLW